MLRNCTSPVDVMFSLGFLSPVSRKLVISFQREQLHDSKFQEMTWGCNDVVIHWNRYFTWTIMVKHQAFHAKFLWQGDVNISVGRERLSALLWRPTPRARNVMYTLFYWKADRNRCSYIRSKYKDNQFKSMHVTGKFRELPEQPTYMYIHCVNAQAGLGTHFENAMSDLIKHWLIK